MIQFQKDSAVIKCLRVDADSNGLTTKMLPFEKNTGSSKYDIIHVKKIREVRTAPKITFTKNTSVLLCGRIDEETSMSGN